MLPEGGRLLDCWSDWHRGRLGKPQLRCHVHGPATHVSHQDSGLCGTVRPSGPQGQQVIKNMMTQHDTPQSSAEDEVVDIEAAKARPRPEWPLVCHLVYVGCRKDC